MTNKTEKYAIHQLERFEPNCMIRCDNFIFKKHFKQEQLKHKKWFTRKSFTRPNVRLKT